MTDEEKTVVLYVAVDIGCIECGEPSAILGVFDNRDDAIAICQQWNDVGWLGGQHAYMVFPVPEINRILRRP